MNRYVHPYAAERFHELLSPHSVRLLVIDPPYSGVAKSKWDHRRKDPRVFAEWLSGVMLSFLPKLTHDGSILFFGGTGMQGNRAFLHTLLAMDASPMMFRNWITWGKRKAYGKEFDYLYTREEIAWYSVSHEYREVCFNIPLTDELRGYKGFNPKYPAKSDYKWVTNVWNDIPELFKTRRECEKPVPLLRRIVETHSNPGDLVVDCFTGLGASGVAALSSGRAFFGCDEDSEAVETAETDCIAAAEAFQ